MKFKFFKRNKSDNKLRYKLSNGEEFTYNRKKGFWEGTKGNHAFFVAFLRMNPEVTVTRIPASGMKG